MRKQGTRMAKTRAPVDDDLLDLDQTISLLKTTRPTFYRWLREGKIKGMKVGRQWRFYRADVERFLKGQEPRIELTADIQPFIDELDRRLASVGAAVRNGEASDDSLTSAIHRVIRLAQVA